MTAFEIALNQYGHREWDGLKNNPEILKYSRECGFSATDVPSDEVSWCSAFMCWCQMKAGYQHTNSLAARSWMDWGSLVTEPQIGDVTIFWRVKPNGWQGHVGFYIRRNNTRIWVLGGNQGNQVCISDYPASQLLGYRRAI